MGFIERLSGLFRPTSEIVSLGAIAPEARSIENPSTPIDMNTLAMILDGPPSLSGVSVTYQTALRIAAVKGAVRLIAESLAGLPIKIVEELKSGTKRVARDHRVGWMLNHQPNDNSTAFSVREALYAQTLLRGNGYGPISLDGAGRVAGIEAARPSLMTPDRSKTGELFYWYDPQGEGRLQKLDRSEVFHVPGLGFDGLVGRSVIDDHRETMGIPIAAERSTAAFMGNGLKPSFTLEHPKTLGEEAQKRLIAQWVARHGGVDKDWKPLLLEEGMKASPLSVPAKDAQFLELQQFSVDQILMIFLPHLIQGYHGGSLTYANVEQRAIDLVRLSFMPWSLRFDQEGNRKLFSTNEVGRFTMHHDFDGFLRGDTKTRYEALKLATGKPFMTQNEARDAIDLEPKDGGDEITTEDIPASDPAPAATPQPPDPNAAARALQPVLDDAFARIMKREGKAFAAAAKRIGERDFLSKFHEWAEEFYSSHEDYVRRALAPVFDALALANGAEDADFEREEMVDRWMGLSRGSLAREIKQVAFGGQPQDLISRFESLAAYESFGTFRVPALGRREKAA